MTGIRLWIAAIVSFGAERHDRERPAYRVEDRIAPARPQAGEDERPAVRPGDRVRLANRALAPPLVERLDRHEAALASRERRGMPGSP